MAQRRHMDGQNASAIADEIISAWFKTSDEGKPVLAFVEKNEQERKMFIEGKM